MSQPKQPEDPPAEGAPVNHNPTGTTPNGIPDGIERGEPKGTPNSDRQDSETAAKPD